MVTAMHRESTTRIDPVEACRRLLVACGNRIPAVAPELLAERLAGWEFLDCGGAVVMRQGAAVHVAAPPEMRGRWLSRRHIDAVLGEAVRQYGRAVTAVMDGNSAGHAFVRRLGFLPMGRDENQTIYELEEVRHAHRSSHATRVP